MTVFETTPAEREAMKKMGEEDPKSKYFYCKPCIKVLSNPNTAVPFMSGMMQVFARSTGVSSTRSEALAKKYEAKLRSIKPRQ